MALIYTEFRVDRTDAQRVYETAGVPGLEDFIRARMAEWAWQWYHANEDRKYKVRVLFFRWSVKVKNIRWFVQLMFGPDPLKPDEPQPEPD